jgi:hypothetical protein
MAYNYHITFEYNPLVYTHTSVAVYEQHRRVLVDIVVEGFHEQTIAARMKALAPILESLPGAVSTMTWSRKDPLQLYQDNTDELFLDGRVTALCKQLIERKTGKSTIQRSAAGPAELFIKAPNTDIAPALDPREPAVMARDSLVPRGIIDEISDENFDAVYADVVKFIVPGGSPPALTMSTYPAARRLKNYVHSLTRRKYTEPIIDRICHRLISDPMVNSYKK